VWIFGYGSLIWRPDFPFEEAHAARLEGWERVFHQASPDHRGTPERPGRVVTLRRGSSSHCWGRAFRIEEASRAQTLAELDVREQGGYERHTVEVLLRDGRGSTVDALTYIAAPDNPHHLGACSTDAMIAQILSARGPSGTNRDYLSRLHRSLEELGVEDVGISELAEALVTHGTP
jgi:cation transport protein ChaC